MATPHTLLGNLANHSAELVTNSTFNQTTTAAPARHPEPHWIYWLPGPFICTFGILCNILNLCVLSQNALHDSPYVYLKALAISDLTLLTISLVHFSTAKASETFVKAFYNSYVFFAVGNIFFNVSVWLVVTLTVERMFFVIRPLTTHSSRKKAWICITAILIFCSVINIPRFFCFHVLAVGEDFYPAGSPFRESSTFYTISWFHSIIINFIPTIVLIVTNSTLIHALHRSSKMRKSLRSNQEEATQRDQARLTRTLIAVVIVFFICTIPSAFSDDPIAYSLFGRGRTWTEYIKSPANQMLIYISNLLLFLNSSLNFVLYCAFNRKFRLATTKFFRKLHSSCSWSGRLVPHKYRASGSRTHTTESTYL